MGIVSWNWASIQNIGRILFWSGWVGLKIKNFVVSEIGLFRAKKITFFKKKLKFLKISYNSNHALQWKVKFELKSVVCIFFKNLIETTFLYISQYMCNLTNCQIVEILMVIWILVQCVEGCQWFFENLRWRFLSKNQQQSWSYVW